MYHHSPLTSSRITDYRTDFGYELSFLPPTAAWNPKSKRERDIEERGLLDTVETSYNPILNPTPVQAPEQSWTHFWKPRRLGFGRYFQLHDPNDPNSAFKGWRRAVFAAAVVTGFVLAVNTIFMIWAVAKFSIEDGVGVIYVGDCDLVKRWNTGLHLTINVLGTMVLAASSFTMQCLCSPTRSEVDAAHAKRRPLEIGLVSFRNLFHVARWKGILWVLLCLSTMPLHLLWNSTIFSTSGTNLFALLVADESFLSGAYYQTPNSSTTTGCGYYSGDLDNVVTTMYDNYQRGSYTRLSPSECLSDYTSGYLTKQRNLIIVVQQPTDSDFMGLCGYRNQPWTDSSLVGMSVDQEPDETWLPYTITGSTYTSDSRATLKAKQQEIKTSGTWTWGNFTVSSCQSEVVGTGKCELSFVSYLLYVVVVCNIIKLICMGVTAHSLWNLNEPIFATVGDAVCSFLEHPDDTTSGLCLIDYNDVKNDVWKRVNTNSTAYKAVYKRKRTKRLYSATTHTRWWWTMIPLTLYVITAFVLWDLSLNNLSQYTYEESMKMNFGAVDAGLILGLDGTSPSGLITDIVVANSFQLVLSATYFLYNSLYTAQCAALEWASYVGGARKFLRVTWPRGQQRMTYYLHLPYRYGIPLTVLLLLLHFLISQSIFLARLQYKDWEGKATDGGFADVGFSPRATLTSCLVGVFMVLAQIAHSFRPLDNRIPTHGNNSAVISAMCHPEIRASLEARPQTYFSQPVETENIAIQPLTWGVTVPPSEYTVPNSNKAGSGHCSFSADDVELPQRGQQYR